MCDGKIYIHKILDYNLHIIQEISLLCKKKMNNTDNNPEEAETVSKSSENTSVITLGCRLNSYESSVMEDILKAENLNNDVIIINTCAVTKEAERKSRQAITKAKRDNPDKKIIVTGCAAQINPEQFSQMPQVYKVIGNDVKNNPSTYKDLALEWSNPLQINTEKAIVNDIMSIKDTAEHLMPMSQDRSRAFLQIQNGCNHRCTFCIIPYGRGNSRSVPVAQVVNNIKNLIEQGYNEVVLTGVDITDYGSDLPAQPKLGLLCKRILSSTTLPRLRLSSIDVAEIDDDIKDLVISEPRFMPYFHISLQSGDNMILKRMKRRHAREDVYKFCDFVRKYRENPGFGADIICGFPTENEEMFANTMALVQDLQIPFMHAFTYSARTGTPAARMPQVPLPIRKDRTRRLIAIGEENLAKFIQSLIGTTQKIILEEGAMGHAENFAKIHITDTANLSSPVGSVVSVVCNTVQNGYIAGLKL